MFDIIIPSCRPFSELAQKISLIKENDDIKFNYIPTGFSVSASVNRNYGFYEAMKSDNEYIIMIDDDIGGFYKGWQCDLIKPLIEDREIKLVSARLMNPDGSQGPMMGVLPDLSKDIIDVPAFMQFEKFKFKAILSAAIAFRKSDIVESGVRFNNNFVGSGFEDTLFCFHLCKAFKDCRIVCTNNCKLIHYHEMKNQSENFKYNENLFKTILACEAEDAKS